MNTFFPNPIEQAVALLSDCRDDLAQARDLARFQALHADEKDNDVQFFFWVAVKDALTPEKGAQA